MNLRLVTHQSLTTTHLFTMQLLSKWTAVFVFALLVKAESRRSVEVKHGSISRSDMSQLGSQSLEPNTEFIDTVHDLAAEMAQKTEVADNLVVWSPFSVVNVLPFVNQLQDTAVIRNGYKESLNYIKSLEGLEISRVSVGYVHEQPTANVTSSEFYDTEILTRPSNLSQLNFTEILEEKFRNLTKYGSTLPQLSVTGNEIKTRTKNNDPDFMDDEPESRIGEEFKDKVIQLPNGTLTEEMNVYLTSLSISAGWETPFHPRYSRKSKFYLNETHAFKTKYLNNIGFYKIAEIPELNASAVAVPIKNTQRLYFVVLLPNTAESLSDVSQSLSQQKITEIWSKFRTRRVQLSIPKISVSSQLLFTQESGNRTSKIIQLGSLRLNYNGIETRYKAVKNTRPEYKLTRLRRRKEDVVFKTNRPFIFYIYDSVKSGILSYGEVLIPNYETNYKQLLKLPPPSLLSQNGKILQESLNHFGEKYYQHLRGRSSEDNIIVAPINLVNVLGAVSNGANKETKTEILRKLNLPQMWEEGLTEIRSLGGPGENVTVSNKTAIYTTVPLRENFNQTSVDNFGVCAATFNESTPIHFEDPIESIVRSANNTVAVYSYMFKGLMSNRKAFVNRFFLNERDYLNTSFIEYSGIAEYVSVPFWDAKILQLPIGAGKQTLLLLIPDEKSGLHLIEDGLRDYPLEKFLCQMRHTHVRVRLPKFNITHSCNISEELSDFGLNYFVGETEFDGIGEGVRINGIAEDLRIEVCGSPAMDDDDSQETGSHRRNSKHRRFHLRRRKFTVDRPFMFYIRDVHVGTLALGRVINPVEGVKNPEIEAVEIVENATEAVETVDITTVVSA